MVDPDPFVVEPLLQSALSYRIMAAHIGSVLMILNRKERVLFALLNAGEK